MKTAKSLTSLTSEVKASSQRCAGTMSYVYDNVYISWPLSCSILFPEVMSASLFTRSKVHSTAWRRDSFFGYCTASRTVVDSVLLEGMHNVTFLVLNSQLKCPKNLINEAPSKEEVFIHVLQCWNMPVTKSVVHFTQQLGN